MLFVEENRETRNCKIFLFDMGQCQTSRINEHLISGFCQCHGTFCLGNDVVLAYFG